MHLDPVAMADHFVSDSHEHEGGFDLSPTPVPVLRLRGSMWDPVALETWREALSSLVMGDVPHELMGMWLFTADNEAELLGPPELEADHLDVPRPDPQLDPKDLRRLEERVRNAGFKSTLTMAVPHGERDVGLILVASLNPDQYGDSEISFLRGVVASLGPTMARVGQQWQDDLGEDDGQDRQYRRRVEPGRALHELRDLLTEMADAFAADQSPASLARGLSHALGGILPHDCLEIIVPNLGKDDYYRLGRHEEGEFFSHAELLVSGEAFDVGVLFGDEDTMLVDDADTDPRAPVWPFDRDDADRIKSVVGVRLGRENAHPVGYIMLGSQGPGLYRKDDLEVLRRLGPLISPRVDQVAMLAELQMLRGNLGMLRQVPAHLGRIAELMATTAHVGVATHAFAWEASAIVPFERLDLALRAGSENEVVVLTPGETKPLRDLPRVDVSGTELGRVLRSEITHTLAAASHRAGSEEGAPSAALIVPLRVAGRAIGTMTLVATGSASFGQADVVLAQQLADIVAPHLELLRRSAFSGGASGSWRRVER